MLLSVVLVLTIISFRTPSTQSLTFVSNPTPIKLNYITNNDKNLASQKPLIIFIHGLDSSSHTWRRVLSSPKLSSLTAIAVDCRGCGNSRLGNPDEFTPEAIVQDIRYTLNKIIMRKDKKKRRVILVGHSMGARICICYASMFPDELDAIIVEDMDIKIRPWSSSFIQGDRNKMISFNRKFPYNSSSASNDSVKQTIYDSFIECGYNKKEMIDRWIDEGRIYKKQSNEKKNDQAQENSHNFYWWSDVNPAFRILCYEQFMDNPGAWSCEDAWKKIAASSSSKKAIQCHVMVAGSKSGTICDEESIQKMKERNPTNTVIHRYHNATHSIHNSDYEKFMDDLEQIVVNVCK